eukprot:gene6188-10195_t
MDKTTTEAITDCLNLIKNGESLQNLPKKFRDNKNLALEIVKINPSEFQFLSEELQNNREIVFEAILNGTRLQRIPTQYKKDKEIVLLAIKKYALNYQHVSPELKDDPEVIICALENRLDYNFIKSPVKFTNDDVIIACIKRNHYFYRSISQEKQFNQKILFEAIKSGISLSVIDPKFRSQKDLMLFSVQINGYNIDNVSNELKNDRDIILTALKQNISAIRLIIDQPIFKEDFIIYIMGKSEIPNFIELIPRDILFQIGMKMVSMSIYELESIEILQFLIDQNLDDEIHKECCFQIGSLYLNGSKKNFKKSKKFLMQSINYNHRIQQSKEKLHQLLRSIKGLNKKEIETLEKCSNAENYEIIKRLTKSSDATIFQVKRKTDNMELVMKKLEIEDMQFNNSLKEVVLLMKLHHPFICEIIDFFVDSTADEEDEFFTFSIIMPMYKSDLYQYIKKNPNLSEKEIERIIVDICYGIQYIHNEHVIHRDLKPQNIFLTDDLKVKIADFGLSCQSSFKTLKKTLCGTKLYAAPEVLEDVGYNYTCDLFSLGGIIYDLISKVKLKSPLSIISLKNEQQKLEKSLKDNISTELKFIMFSLLEENPKKRMSIHSIVKLLNGNLSLLKPHCISKNTEIPFTPTSPESSKITFSKEEIIPKDDDNEENGEIFIQSKQEIDTLISMLKEKKQSNTLNDKESVISALKHGVIEYSSVSSNFRNDRDINLEVIKQRYPLEHIYEPMQQDKEIILEAIKLQGSALKCVVEDLKMDQEFMKKVVQISPFSLQYSSLNQHKKFVIDLIKENEICFFFISSELQNDSDFCLECIKRNYKCFQYFPSHFHSNKKFIKKAMLKNTKSLQYISEELKNSESFALELVQNDGMALEFLSSHLKNNKKIVKTAFENNFDCYCHISKEIKYSIKSNEYNTLEKLAEGGEGIIFKVEKNGKLFAEKRIIIDDMNQLNNTIKQFTNLLLLKHENIFKIVDIIQGENEVLESMMIRIIMELYDGDLSDYIDSYASENQNQNLKEEDIIDIGIQISKGLMYIHQNGIVHGDLKPENIFYKKQENGKIAIRIGDFGMNDFKNFEFYGSMMYVAPEIVDLTSFHSVESDCFSLGGIFMRMMKYEDELVYLKSLKDEFDFEQLDYSTNLKNIVLKLLNKNPKLRPSIEETLNILL